VHLSRRTRRRHNSGRYRVTSDTAFGEVMETCASPRKGESGTWITADMQHAFNRLHLDGYAHAVEVWRDHVLVGGIYGLAIGRMFFGESMFSHETDASKIALVALCRQLEAWQFPLLDCQVPNPHLQSLGAVQISRPEFERQLQDLTKRAGTPGCWTSIFSVSERW